MRTSKHRILAALLALVMVFTLLPVSAFAADGDTVTATKINSKEELSSGEYILLNDAGYAAASLNGNWVIANALSANGNTVEADPSLVWKVEVSENGVTLTDSNGVTIAPAGGNNNGIKSGSYVWGVSFTNGSFSFLGQGSDTVILACNKSYDYKIRAYKSSTVTGTPAGYPSTFSLYKLDTNHVVTDVNELTDGAQVVVFNPAAGKTLSTEYSGFYNKYADVTLEDGTLNGFTEADLWTVGVNEGGTYTFANADGKKLAMGASYTSMPLDEVNRDWKVVPVDGKEGIFYIDNAVRTDNYRVQWRADKSSWSAYHGTGEAFELMLYLVVEMPEDTSDGSVLEDGAKVVIYNQSAQGVLAEQNDTESINSVPCEITDKTAVPENGAVLFTIEKNGDYYRFNNETYGYLCSNGTGNNAFYSKEASEDADWKVTPAQGGVGGYNLESRTAKFNGQYSQYLEYYADSYKSYSMYNVTDYTIYSFSFLPLAEGVKLYNGIVNTPAVVFGTEADAMVGQDYQCNFTLSDVADITEVAISASAGEKSAVIDNYTVDGKNYSFAVDSALFESATSLEINVAVKNSAGNEYSGKLTVKVLDEPAISDIAPANGSETGDNKLPAISANVVNAGENPTVVLKLNDNAVEASYADGMVTYTPSAALEDGRVNVSLTITRADGKSVTKTWFFTVGKAQYQLYFGQLHSHTTVSDGSGTLDAALDYFKTLPESANVDFVAFTDHSNYFDSSSSANPEQALYDTSLATASSQEKWSEYRSKVADFNAANSGSLVAIAGFEMTWSGGPGHMNTFNSPGVVSRNNSTLNNKTNDAGMKAYYALLSQSEGADTVSQFNHPGSTFGTFADFSYWDAVIDNRIFLVEVGNGEGQIGSGGYYPSYEYYTMALDKGWHVAPTNNQDNHKGKWGNANDARDVILTDDFSENGIYNAMRQMRVYSTEDKNLEILYTVNGLQLGSQITEIPEELEINVQVNDPDASDSISKVEVIVNSGQSIYTWSDPAELSKGDLSVTLKPEYSYYYIRVTEGDGDLAVTAPVWVGESLKLGISSLECGTSTPVTGEELELTTTLFNSEAVPAEVKSLTFTTNGGEVIGSVTDPVVIGASENKSISFKFTPEKAKVMKITVTAVIEQDGKGYTFTKDIELDVLNADSLVYIGIDASHYNEYVAGNYKDSMGNFGNLAAGYSVRTVELKTSEDLIAACSNDKFKALILTAPSRRLAAAQSDPRTYSAAEIEAITAFNNAGGAVIVAGWSDNYENYSVITGNSDIKHMSAAQNDVLAALGSSLRINDDATVDDTLNGGQSQRLYFSTYNMDSFLLAGVDFDAEHPNDVMYTERYSQYGGCSIYAVDAQGNAVSALPSTVTPIVYGHSSTYTKDSDSDGMVSMKYPYAEGDDRVLVLASEQQQGKGMVIVAGAAFMSNFEVQATASDNGAEKNYSNYKICENLVKYVNPVTVTDIAEVQKQTEAGLKYTIKGVVTSNASGYDKDTAFFDCIYVQDATAGVCCFPVAGNFKIGDEVLVTGTTDFYQGEMELQVSSIEKVGEGEVTAAEVSAKQVNDGSVLGSLVTVKGVVESFELENGLVQTIMVIDSAGDTVRVFIDGYITTAQDVKNLEVGCKITVTGLASYDNTFNGEEGPYPRIRVRDRADVVCTENDCTHENILIQKAKEATCTEEGYTGDKVCTECGAVVEKGSVIEAKGHKYENGECTVCHEKDPSVPENPFVDVQEKDYFYNAVMWGIENNITNGIDETHFSPNSTCTRAQAVTFLWRQAGCPTPTIKTSAFTDIKAGAYYYDAVLWAVENNITNGTSKTTFSPNAKVTRAQVVTFIYRLAGEPTVSGTSKFVDVPSSAYYYNAVLWAVENEITNGMGNNKFAPNTNCNRANIITFIYRYDGIK